MLLHVQLTALQRSLQALSLTGDLRHEAAVRVELPLQTRDIAADVRLRGDQIRVLPRQPVVQGSERSQELTPRVRVGVHAGSAR